MSKDPAKHGSNWYSYCLNDSPNRSDANGLWFETALDIAGVGYDSYQFGREPTLINGVFLAWSVISVFVPIIPGSWVARGAKLLAKGAEAEKVAEGTRGGVYLLLNLGTGENYVGRTKDLIRRIGEHGDEWTHQVLAHTDDYKEQRFWEQDYLEGRGGNAIGLGSIGNRNKINGIRNGSDLYDQFLEWATHLSE
jgi:hypothetical protein